MAENRKSFVKTISNTPEEWALALSEALLDNIENDSEEYSRGHLAGFLSGAITMCQTIIAAPDAQKVAKAALEGCRLIISKLNEARASKN